MEEKELLPKDYIKVEIKWKPDSNLESIYVNHIKMTHTGPEFYLTFGELPMPAILQGQKFPKELEIIPKVRLVISPEQIKAISDVISENCEIYLRKNKK